jgi:formylglycine-generating enzyme required for sulfatase activity
MSTAITVESGGDRQVFTAADLPLSVGGTGCHVPFGGPRVDGPVAFLGHDNGEVFIQPRELPHDTPPVTCNGVPLTASRWLGDGDELAIGDHRMRCEISGTSVRLRVLGPDRQRPNAAAANRGTSGPPATHEKAIVPADFEPRWQAPPQRPRITIRPRSLLVIIAATLLATCAWFVLTARAVHIETSPVADEVQIRGSWLVPKIGDSYLLRPGTYTVAAELAGYRRIQEAIEVNDTAPSRITLVFEPLGGLLTITSKPVEGAEVNLDGAVVGTTPVRDLEVGAGEHMIEVTAPLHLPFQTAVAFEPGDPPRSLTADLVPNWAPLTINSDPANATVSVDGMVVGQTPLEHRVEAGERRVEIRRSGFKPVSRQLKVTAGEEIDLGLVQLIPVDGRLVVVSVPGGASVTVDDVFRGTTPLEMDLAPGSSYEINVSMAGHAAYEEDIAITSGQRSEVRAELKMLTGEVSVTSVPTRAELLIDGVPTGTTDQTLELEARPHLIEIRLDGYVPFRTTMTPEPGLTQAVHATLKEAGPAGLPSTISSPQGIDLVLVGPGRFTMGAARREPGRRANEVMREVEITRPYYLAVREVTNKEFREFKAEHLSGSFGRYNLEIDHHPVVNVSWNDAARYCNWLSDRAGLPQVYVERSGRMITRSPLPNGFRLPTEAEWAWAARYPDKADARKYAWGDSLPVPPGAGNYGDSTGAAVLDGAIPGYSDNHAATAPAGSFQPNPLGLYNLGGNVSEWMHDVYAVTPSSSGEVTRDPTGPSEGAYHVIRGSSWMDTSVTELRLSYRDYGDQPRPDLGFRIARSAQ